MNIRIVADSSCDLLALEAVDYISVPLSIQTDKDEFVDNGNLDVEAMVEQLLHYQGRSYTSCPSLAQWEDAFEGADEIYVFAITKGLSGSYNGANAAKAEHLEAHPEKKIYVFDTLSAGPEITLAVWKLRELILAGTDFDTACRKIDDYIKSTALLFGLKSVHNFAQNGRISKVASVAGGMLGIHILGQASAEGTLQLCAKLRGASKLRAGFVSNMEKMGYQGGRALIGHVMNEDGAQALREDILKLHPNADISIHHMRGLCSYYAEKGGILIGFER